MSPPRAADPLVRFIAWTGLRTGEVSGLNVGDVDLLHHSVRIRRTRTRRGGEWVEHTPKSGKARTVPMMPWVEEDVRALLASHPRAHDPGAPLWPGSRPGGSGSGRDGRFTTAQASGSVDFGQPWEPGTFLRRRFRPATLSVGLGSVRLHDLRHTFASLAASRGVPSPQVAEWLGHSDDVITRQIYTHLFATDTALNVARLAGEGRPRASSLTQGITPLARRG